MERFLYRSFIHHQNLSCFREWEAWNDCYFLVAAAGLNTRTFLNSDKIAELRPWPVAPEALTGRIETLCRLFIDGYRQASLRKNPQAAPKTGEEIIESLGMLWLHRDGSGYVYQAGKCTISVLRKNHAIIAHPGAGTLWHIQSQKGDRVIADLKRADLTSWLWSIPIPEQMSAGDSLSPDINYPFSITWVDTMDDPVTAEIKIDGNEPEVPSAADVPVLPPETYNRNGRPSEEAYASKPSKNNNVKKRLSIIVAVAVAAGTLLAGWLRSGTFTGFSPKQKTTTGLASEVRSNGGHVDRDAASLLAISAQAALSAADEHLREGRNAQALIQLDSAERRFLRYLSVKPGSQPSIQSKLNEILQKKELVRGEENF